MGLNYSCNQSGNAEQDFKKLSDLKIGDCAEVVKISCHNEKLKVKIMEMGLVSGVKLQVIKKAPLNDPISIMVRGYDLSLRKDEADSVIVRVPSFLFDANCGCCSGIK